MYVKINSLFKLCIIPEEHDEDELFKKRQLMRLKNYFESYDIDFLDNSNECIRAYDEPKSLIKYFQNMSKKNLNFNMVFFFVYVSKIF